MRHSPPVLYKLFKGTTYLGGVTELSLTCRKMQTHSVPCLARAAGVSSRAACTAAHLCYSSMSFRPGSRGRGGAEDGGKGEAHTQPPHCCTQPLSPPPQPQPPGPRPCSSSMGQCSGGRMVKDGSNSTWNPPRLNHAGGRGGMKKNNQVLNL